jgi:PAS domain S-box-containing protein
LYELGDLRLGEQIARTDTSVLRRATTVRDGRSVLLRLASGEPGEGAGDLHHELELTRTLGPDAGVLLPQGEVRSAAGLGLVYPDPGVDPVADLLRGPPLPLAEVLDLAVGVAGALEQLHGRAVAHLGLRPESILVERRGGRAWLTDLGRAVRLNGDHHVAELRSGPVPLAWISPEQTGRVDRAIDRRSDLYSLGVLLYRLLAGQLPFDADDTLGWVHQHLAARPPSLDEADVPGPLARVVERLLEKSPEDRYQTASGLARDLERCQRDWRDVGRLRDFEPGRLDSPDRIKRAGRVCGRGPEQALLAERLRELTRGGRGIVLVSGESGVGKTFLVERLVALRAPARARVLTAKGDQAGADRPYGLWNQTGEQLALQLAEEPAAEAERVRRRLQEAVGATAGALVDITPDLAPVLGYPASPPPLAPDAARNRLNLAGRRMFQALATAERPLVVILDDLQWADRASVKALEALLGSAESRHMLVVGTLRSGSEIVPLLEERIERIEASGATVDRLTLGDLPLEPLAQLIGDALEVSPDQILGLARLVEQKTGGNPQFVDQFLSTAWRSGHLRFEPSDGGWLWDESALRTLPLSENVVELLGANLSALPGPTLRTLRIAACLGNTIGLAHLSQVIGVEIPELEVELEPALAAGFLVPAGADGPLRFAHDRVQAAALDGLTAKERADLHLRAGRALQTRQLRDSSAALLFAVVDHLNRAAGQLDSAAERRELALLDLEAGRRALAAGSWDTARDVLAAGRSLLADDAWRDDYALCLDLHAASAEAEYLSGRADRADALVEAVVAQARQPLDQARLERLRIQLHINQFRFPEAIDEALRLLRLLGVEVDESGDPTALPAGLAAVAEARAGRSFDELAAMPDMEDPVALAALEILVEIIPAATMGRPKISPALTFAAIGLFLRGGLSPQAAAACSTHGLLLCLFGMIDEGYAYGELGVRLRSRYLSDPVAGTVDVQFPVFIQHLREPLRATLPRLAEGAGRCLAVGALENHGYCVNQGYSHALFAAEPLDLLDGAWQELNDRLVEGQQAISGAALGIFGQVVAALRSGPGVEQPWRLRGDRFDLVEQAPQMEAGSFQMGLFLGHAMQLWLALLFDRVPEALDALRAARPVAMTCRGMFVLPQFDFHAALALIRAIDDALDDTDALRAELTEHRDRLATLAEAAPHNHGFRLTLVDAELARVEGRLDEAMDGFDHAIRDAGANRFLAEASLGHRCAARLHRSQGRPAATRAHLLAARCITQTWGDHAVAACLEDQLTALSEGGLAFRPSPPAPGGGSIDLDTVLRVSSVLAGTVDLDELVARLLRFVIENAGASRGLLFLSDGEQLRLTARARLGAEPIVTPDGPELEAVSDVAAHVIRYVRRIRQPVALDDARAGGLFRDDPYIRDREARSLLCLPLESRGDLVGLLYLENELVGGAFTRSRIDLLRVVSSLAATMVENARLYATLQRTTAELRRSHAMLESYSSDLESRVEQRTAELADLYEQHQLILESIEEGIVRLDPDGRLTFANPAAEKMTGLSSNQLIGRSHHVLLADTVGDEHQEDCPLCRSVAGLPPEAVEHLPMETDLRRLGSEPLPVELTARPILGDSGREGTVVTFRDITRRRQLQLQLEHAQRLETLGKFVGAVAHDFNNLLTPLLGGAAQLLDLHELDSDSRLLLENMERASQRASELVQQMLAFGRRTKIFMQPTDVASLIDEIGSFLRHALARDITLEVHRPDDLAWTWGDRVQLHQVLLNLSVNAQDALEAEHSNGGPKLVIEAKELEVGADRIPRDSTAEPGRFIELSVRDNGPGIPRSVARRMFEPFYTTKEAGRGTGLGLSVVYGIVQSHRGWVECDTAPGAGTTFRVYLPGREIPSGGFLPVRSGDFHVQQHARILVVDDEPMVRDLIATALRHRGHEVVEACDGARAVEIYDAESEAIDLVLLDLVMPGMSGEDVLVRLRERDPEVRVCLVSGYSEGPTADSYQEMGARAFLGKPFTVSRLVGTVREVLTED